MSALGDLFGTPTRRKVFVSYHHAADQVFYNSFSQTFHDRYELLFDNSVERAIQSDNSEYVIRRIREHHLTGASCTIVLCGAGTPGRKFVDWEIKASLDQQMGLIGVMLPTIYKYQNGGTAKPARLQDNIDSGYAVWIHWDDLATGAVGLPATIETANGRAKYLIVNNRSMMARNA